MNANTHIGFGFTGTIGLLLFGLIGISLMTLGLVEAFSTWPPQWGPAWELMKRIGGDLGLIVILIIASVMNGWSIYKRQFIINELEGELEIQEENQRKTRELKLKNAKKGEVDYSIPPEEILMELKADWDSGKYKSDPTYWDNMLKTNRVKMYGETRTKCLAYRRTALENEKKELLANMDYNAKKAYNDSAAEFQNNLELVLKG